MIPKEILKISLQCPPYVCEGLGCYLGTEGITCAKKQGTGPRAANEMRTYRWCCDTRGLSVALVFKNSEGISYYATKLGHFSGRRNNQSVHNYQNCERSKILLKLCF